MGTQPLLDFNPRAAARATDPVTSIMAAERVSAHVSRGQMLALKAFYDHPDEALDDFQLAELTGWRQTSIGKRRGELEQKGYVLKAGRRVSPSNLTDSVVQSYEITDEGLAFYARETAR